MSAINYATIVISFASIAISFRTMYINGKPVHEARQKFRVESDGWTLKWWWCWTYWLGLEYRAPARSRVIPGRLSDRKGAENA